MVKKNQTPKPKTKLEKHFYSCVARRTRANTHLYIARVAEQLNNDRKRKPKRDIPGRVINDYVEVTEISEDSDAVQKMGVDVKKNAKRKCVLDNDDSGGLRFKREAAHHSGLGVAEEEKKETFDEDVVEIESYGDDDDDMSFDVKRSQRSRHESYSRNQQYEAGESSVLKTENREDLAESDADYNYSPSSQSDKDDSDYHVGMSFSEPESDDKSSSFVGEEDDDNDEEEEKPQHYQKRFNAAAEYAFVETTVSDDILMEDEVKPEPVSSDDECIIIERTESVELDESCSSKREDESPIQIVDSDDEIVLESSVQNVDAEKKMEREKIDETLGSCNNNNNSSTNVVKESRFTENVYLNDNYVESGLNKVNAVKESEIKKFHESIYHKVAKYFYEQKSRKCDHEIEQASKTAATSTEVVSAEEFLRTGVVDNDGEPKNGATVEEEKEGLNIESRAALTADFRSSNVDDPKLKHEVTVEDEKISEVIRRDVTFSDACEFRFTEQDETERKPFSSKYDSENVPDQLKFTSGALEEIPVEKASEELESVRHWSELYCALAGEELDLVPPLEGEQVMVELTRIV